MAGRPKGSGRPKSTSRRVGDEYSNEIGYVLVCPICRKTFIPAAYHVYHAYGAERQKRVCSYTCMVEAERRNEAKKKKTGAAAHKKK